MSARTIAKVGGSLFDLPDLATRLQRWRTTQPGTVLFVPGGGALADVVRAWQPRHHLSEDTAHWLAIRTMTLNAHFLAACTRWPVVTEPTADATAIVDVFSFLERDTLLPHTWDVTSDSIAAHLAHTWHADLVLLKSTASLEVPWPEASVLGLVDRAFPTFAVGLRIGWVNLRA